MKWLIELLNKTYSDEGVYPMLFALGVDVGSFVTWFERF